MFDLLSSASLPFEFLERSSLHERFGLLQDVADATEVDHPTIVYVDPMVYVEPSLHFNVISSVER